MQIEDHITDIQDHRAGREVVKRQLRDVLDDLPEICAATNEMTGEAIFIKKGQMGYWPAKDPHMDVDHFNRQLGVSPAQREAMSMGSLFGFHVPGADPLNHEG